MSAITDYLTLFYRQRHINKMPEANWQTFVKYVQNKGLRGHMERWKKDLLHEDPAGSGNWVRNELPDGNKEFKWTKLLDSAKTDKQVSKELTEKDWKELFNKLQEIFIRMDTNRQKDKFEEPGATAARNFVLDFYSPNPADGKLFSLKSISPDIEARIDKFTQILMDDNADQIVMDSFGDKRSQKAQNDFDNFKNDMKNKKYLTDAKVRDKLLDVLDTWENKRFYSGSIIDESGQRLFTQAAPLGVKNLLEELRKPAEVTEEQLKRFRGIANGENAQAEYFVSPTQKEKLPYYQAILTRIHDNSNVYREFKKCEYPDTDISESLDKAKALTDYTGKTDAEDEVPAASYDSKDFVDEIKDKIEDTYKDSIKSLAHLHRDHLYISKEAQFIMKAIDKLKDDDGKPIKITPKDGIGAIIKNAEAIKKAVRKDHALAVKHFEWFITAMNDMKPEVKKAFANATHNGGQMQTIVESLAEKAVKASPQKIDEAKTALEVLAVMQYGTFTGRTMDAIKGTDFSLFSDDKLSWNKNAGIRFVTGALDKTIKVGSVVAGYAATAGMNRIIRRVGKKFNHSGKMQDKIKEEQARLDLAKADNIAKNKIDDERDNQQIAALDAKLTELKNTTKTDKLTKTNNNNVTNPDDKDRLYALDEELKQLSIANPDKFAIGNDSVDIDYAVSADNLEVQKQLLKIMQERLDLTFSEPLKKVVEYTALEKQYIDLIKNDAQQQRVNQQLKEYDSKKTRQEQLADVNTKIAKMRPDMLKWGQTYKKLSDKNKKPSLEKPLLDANGKPLEDPRFKDVGNETQESMLSSQLVQQYRQLSADKNRLDKDIKDNPMLDEEVLIKAEKQEDTATLKSLQDERAQLLAGKEWSNIKTEYENTFKKTDANTGKTPYKDAVEKQATYQEQKDKLNKLSANIAQYENIVEQKKTLEDAKTSRQTKIAEWETKNKNGYAELMAYWDFLQTGKTKTLFHLSVKKLQEKMDEKNADGKTLMQQKFEAWKTSHHYGDLAA